MNGKRIELVRHWRGPGRNALANCLRRGEHDAFDQFLLRAVSQRNRPQFYFQPADIERRLRLARRIVPANVAHWIANANRILQGQFPLYDDDPVPALPRYRLPRHFSWLKNPTDDMQFVHALNRHRFWVELAVAYRLTGKAKYADEFKRQLVSWTKQNPPVDNPHAALKVYPRWHLLDAAIRGDTWVWTFFLLVGTEAWTPAINTLFLRQLWEHGRFLDHLPPRGLGGNWTIMQAQGLLNIALLFPEFKESADWERHAKHSLLACFLRQFLPDGGHIEQSPSYHEGSLRWIVEPLYLATLNGRAWARQLMPRVRKSVEYFFLMLQPNGYLPLVSDSDRVGSSYLPGLSLLFNEPRWLRFRKPGLREVLMFGNKPAARRLPRPNILAFRESGYYVMRSGDKPDDLQIVFDCGHKGGFHGHFDLLSFELTGFGRSLICDPGRLTYNRDPDRDWIVSTPAHNTISVDGLNHESFESARDRHFRVTRWDVGKDRVRISAHHRGYEKLSGRPVVGRTLQYGRHNSFLLLDWGISDLEHEYTVSFTLPGRSVATARDGGIYTTHPHGNVWIQPLLLPGQRTKRELKFWSPSYGRKESAIRFTVRQRTRHAFFATLVVAYAGPKPPRGWAPLHAWSRFPLK